MEEWHRNQYQKRLSMIVVIAVLLALLIVVLAASIQAGQPHTEVQKLSRQSSSLHPTLEHQPSDISWKRYTNPKYGYHVSYPSNLAFLDFSSPGHSSIDLSSGNIDVRLLVNPQDSLPSDFSRQMLMELDALPEGATKTYSNKIFFKKLPSRQIGEERWASFEITTIERDQVNFLYFIRRDGKIYFISLTTSKQCCSKIRVQILNSFDFTN